MLDSAEEFVTFGAILGINQGIRTDVDGKLAYLNRIENIFKNRFDKGASIDVNDILASKPYYVRFYGGEQEARNYIQATIDKANSLGIFNFGWLCSTLWDMTTWKMMIKGGSFPIRQRS